MALYAFVPGAHMMMARLAEWYLNLLPVYPPKLWTNPTPLERATREYESERSGGEAFLPQFPQLRLDGLDVLDLGCGAGGRSVRFKELGARHVTGVEIMDDMIQEARAFATERAVDVDFRIGAAERIPCAANSFDVVISYDVFEHVDDVAASLRESYRVLRPGGTLYAIFPPIHHPTGGSHFHGYLSRSPAPTLLFRPRALMSAATAIEAKRGQVPITRRPTDYLPSVNGTTIRQFNRYLRAIPFRDKRVSLHPLRTNRLPFLNPVFSVGSRIPWVREIATERIVAVLRK